MNEVAVSSDHAKRWAERARLDLEASADRGEAGLTKIRTAIAERHDMALEYRSIGDYVSKEFADALGNVCRVFGVEFRRQVVAELSDAGGMSTRAIAAVTGTSDWTVRQDQSSGARGLAPEPAVNRETGEVTTDYTTTPQPEPTNTVTGIDGKTYQRPEPSTPKKKPITEIFFTAAYDLARRVEAIHKLTDQERFAPNAEKIAAKHRNDLIRTRDLLNQIIDRLPEA